jgi:hypothetical protein
MQRRALSWCRPPGQGKPCWITEWGFANEDLVCPIDDRRRARLALNTRQAFESFAQERRIAGLLWYNWKTDATSSIYRCNAVTPSGRIALAPMPFAAP